ncbi:putative cytokinetic ring protein SteA [Nocardioides sp. BP30]|uniref:putative cytokinetic ring protein SteA n=1 Tax=Nocardioides sp. BP30 TaxID=3036374 RepID=UPI00246823B3|nr:putative cytokinetic ring protein SteA [Nocardioides sp. BP30]WGL50519.1 putative cytokinetic ring protein SteA [Nocardioides sp. BP30]
MKLPTRTATVAPAGIVGTLRAGRPTRSLIPRLRAGDIVVIDHVDLDRPTAQRMLDAGVAAVINAQPMTSGRFPNLGPQLLVEAGIVVVDGVGEGGFAALADGRTARVDGGTVYDGEQRLTTGRVVDRELTQAQMAEARAGMATQLQTISHISSELVRREQAVLLHGIGLPALAARLEDRPVLVVADAPETSDQLRRMRTFLREQRPAVVATAAAARAVRQAGLRPDVVVVGAGEDLPEAKVLRAAKDVVVCGASAVHDDSLSRIGTAPHHVLTSLASRDIALLLAQSASPRVLIVAGMGASLTDLLDRDRDGAAGSFLSRLAAGQQVVDASAVPTLYSGRVRVRHVVLALLICVLLVAAAIATTDVGHDWLRDLLDQIGVQG